MNLDQLDNLPKLTVESGIWDMTWILNKTAILVERYNMEVVVKIKRSNSVIIDIIIAAAFGPIISEIGKRFADDLYKYVKDKITRKLNKPILAEPMFEEKQALPSTIINDRKEDIKISWNKAWEEKGFEHDKEDGKLK